MKCILSLLLLAFVAPLGLSAAEPRTLEEALLNYPWEWTHAPKPPDLLIFTKNGVANCERFSWHWKITGPNTALGFEATMHDTGKRMEKYIVEMTFSPDFRTLRAQTPDGKFQYSGRRLGADGMAKAPSVPNGVVPAQTVATIILTDVSQPRIQVIKDQGPNATEWALTPLGEAIPADIRQNITLLREDLLDEGKKAPKASAEAYKLASNYCDKVLATLDQRELARVNAGYRAAQADASKNTSSQALDVRRNYKMSWPQYAREESQRAALRENETDKADVKKERLKVEWAARTAQMRPILDALYRQFREALR